MHDKFNDLPEALALLEQHRMYVSQIKEMAEKITSLEHERQVSMRAHDELSCEVDRYRKIKSEAEWFFENSLDLLAISEPDGQIRRVNQAFERVLGYRPEEMIGFQLVTIMHPDDQEKAKNELRLLASGKDSVNSESRCRHKNGEWRWISWTCPSLTTRERGLYAIGRDITEKKASEAEILYRAQHDFLTTLPNRATFDQSLGQAVVRAARSPQYEVGLLLIDLDGFKAINDCYGHAAGDIVLRTVALRLLSCQRKNELVCRLGGDEFAWIVEGLGPLSLTPLAERIIKLVCEPISLGGTRVTIACSIGVAIYLAPEMDVDSLYKRADAAMYSVKRSGKNGFAHYLPDQS